MEWQRIEETQKQYPEEIIYSHKPTNCGIDSAWKDLNNSFSKMFKDSRIDQCYNKKKDLALATPTLWLRNEILYTFKNAYDKRFKLTKHYTNVGFSATQNSKINEKLWKIKVMNGNLRVLISIINYENKVIIQFLSLPIQEI